MTKKYFLLLLLLLSSFSLAQKNPSRIDQIQTKEEAQSFFRSIDDRYKEITIGSVFDINKNAYDYNQCLKRGDSLGVKEAFYKADFNHDGLTDLLLTGFQGRSDYYVFVVLGNRDGKYEKIDLTKDSFSGCSYPKILKNNLIQYYYLSRPGFMSREKTYFTNTKLIYKFGAFVDYNPSPHKYNIEKIEFKAGGCYGTCPVFELLINGKGQAIFKAIEYNKRSRVYRDKDDFKGYYTGTIDKKSFKEVTDLLNYTDFPKLKDSYTVSWTDDATVHLEITYDGGKVKKIKDYGTQGTFGLERLYRLLYDLRYNQTWK